MKWFKCGNAYPHDKDKGCLAKDKTCRSCKQVGHFEKCCRNSNDKKSTNKTNNNTNEVNRGELEQRLDERYFFALNSISKDRPLEWVKVNGVKLEMLIDSGASDDVIHEIDFKKLSNTASLTPDGGIWAYGQEKSMDVLGKFNAILETENGRTCETCITVIRSAKPTIGLISFQTSRKLGLWWSRWL